MTRFTKPRRKRRDREGDLLAGRACRAITDQRQRIERERIGGEA